MVVFLKMVTKQLGVRKWFHPSNQQPLCKLANFVSGFNSSTQLSYGCAARRQRHLDVRCVPSRDVRADLLAPLTADGGECVLSWVRQLEVAAGVTVGGRGAALVRC